LFIIITYVLFPGLCATIFSAFICEDFDDGTSLLRTDYSIDCKQNEYKPIYSYALIMVFVYPLGIPFLYMSMLFLSREKLDPQEYFEEMSLSQAVRKREQDVNHLKFLYDAFKPKFWYMEVFECLRKLMLTGFVVFFYEGSALQVAGGTLVAIWALMVYSYTRPYLMRSNNTFAIFAHFQVFFTLFCSLLIRMDEFSGDGESSQSLQFDSEQLGTALLISNLSVLVLGVILMAKACLTTSEGDFVDTGYVYNEKTGKYEIGGMDTGGDDDLELGDGGNAMAFDDIFKKTKTPSQMNLFADMKKDAREESNMGDTKGGKQFRVKRNNLKTVDEEGGRGIQKKSSLKKIVLDDQTKEDEEEPSSGKKGKSRSVSFSIDKRK